MIIKLKKRSGKFILGVLFVLVLPLLAISKHEVILAKEDAIQYVMTMNLGFSHRMNLVDSGDGSFALASKEAGLAYRKLILPSIVKSIPKIIKYKVFGKVFDRMDIDIKYIDFREIMRDRDRALKSTILTDPTVVNAKIKFRGRGYKAKLRLKGDLVDHWASKYRMSFRVRLKGGGTILGNKKFSLHKPYARYHPYDYAFQSMVRGVGNLSPVHNLVHLYVNGTDWGIMDMEEHMSKEFLERLKRKESAVVRFGNEKLWSYTRAHQDPYSRNQDPYSMYRISDPTLFVRLYGSGKNLKNNHYRKMYSYISKHNITNAAHLYDIDSFTRAYLLATAWADWHALLETNSRYYFNPYTLKLEPITTDQLEYLDLKDVKNLISPDLPRQYLSVMSTSSYANNLSDNLNSVSKVVSDTQRYLDDANLFFPVDKKKNGEIVVANFNRMISEQNLYLTPQLEDTAEDDKAQIILPTYKQASGFGEHLHIRHYTDGRLELYNLLPDKVAVKDILFEGESLIEDEFTVPGYLLTSSPVVFTTQLLGIQDEKITVKTEYQGFNRHIKNKITLISDEIENPLLLDTVQGTDFLKRLKNENYELKQGKWVVNEPIVVNGDLYIPPGVNIKFSKNAYLIVKGALTAVGGINEPIVLESSLDSWKGIYVIKANKRSRLNNVIIKNIAALEDGLLKLTGGITFYKSDVDLENVKIEGAVAEDAINIVESIFTMNSVEIINTASDGLDSDFSQGTVSQSIFSNVGGDAMDFSGSNIEIDKVEIVNVKDKAVSGGEGSTINIKNSTFNGIGVGIASKDGSNMFVANTNISDYSLHAVMSYIKKDFYSVPSVELVDCKIDQGEPFVRQIGSNMIVDGIEIPETKVNVKKLYQSEAMKK